MPTTRYVAFWNVENLFDVEDAETLTYPDGTPRRTDKLRRALGTAVDGWTQALVDRKLDQLVSIVAQMNGGAGPDLLGVCEVENLFVLEALRDRLNAQLPNRSYLAVHADTRDERGIDTAFLYEDSWLSHAQDQVFMHVVMRRTATREILQVNFDTALGRRWAVFCNHWPARSGGELESAGYRAIAGETLSYFHSRVLAVHGSDTPVLVMGDFNDQPFDPSIERYALGTRSRQKVLNSTTAPRLWNLMWPIMGTGVASFYYGNWPNLLDQFLANKNMIKQTGDLRVIPDSVEVLRFAGHNGGGDYEGPVRFGGHGKPVDQNGFSDHYPIGMQVLEED